MCYLHLNSYDAFNSKRLIKSGQHKKRREKVKNEKGVQTKVVEYDNNEKVILKIVTT